MKSSIIVALLAAVVSLCGCYESNILLLDPTAARQPLAAGDYGPIEDRRRFIPRSDGWYDEYKWIAETGEWQPSRSLLLNELGFVEGRTTYAVAQPSPEGSWLYGVVALTEDGGFIQSHPDCMMVRDFGIALRNGASQSEESAICRFSESDDLLAALAEWAAASSDLRAY